ncbi:MAG: Stp1/IreP family PP2C-type Ser/Thr phosphatase [Thermoanaerobaculia bacterium]
MRRITYNRLSAQHVGSFQTMSEQATAAAAVSTGPLVVRAVLRTDVGRVRSENQDFGTLTTVQDARGTHTGGRLLIVADGMGGHRGGATASRLAAETVKTRYLESETDDISAALKDALTRANTRIFNEAQTNFDLRGMGTTTSALAVRGNQAWFGHVGDSRIYFVRENEIRQLTEDHSLVASMVREGLLTSKEAENHPRRNVLQRSIGVSDEVEVDVVGPLEVQERDLFILCSDGLHGLVKPNEIQDIVSRLTIEQAADELVKCALERGAPDNVTVIVARIERADDDPTIVESDRLPYDETVLEDPRSADVITSRADGEESGGRDASPLPDSSPSPQLGMTSRPRASAVVKWALLFVAILAIAGAWLFLNQQQMFQDQKSSSSSKR